MVRGSSVNCLDSKQRDYRDGIEAPEIGRWYSSSNGSLFEVVAVDEDYGTIELQHFDGTLEETEPEDWLAMHAQAAEPPEDWSGSVDMDPEDYVGKNDKEQAVGYQEPLSFLDKL